VQIEPGVSGRGLPKTGIFEIFAGDYPEISPWKWPNLESGRPTANLQKPAIGGHF
jgi:hypothetical protein